MAKTRSLGFRIWRHHVLMGVPLAAFFHSILQFAYDPMSTLMDAPLFVAHVALGSLFGVVILGPAFSVQAAIFFALSQRTRVSPIATTLLCGGLQALFVWCWDLAVGIQPSLGGRFSLAVPMILAGALSGVIVAWSARRILRS